MCRGGRGRLAGRVISVPVLAALGVTEDGQKQLVTLQLAAAEATASWSSLLADLQRRGLAATLLVVSDGHAGLKKALEAWPTVQVQRCTTHKGRNLKDPCPPMRGRSCGATTTASATLPMDSRREWRTTRA